MSYCKQVTEKDRVVFLTEEEASKESSIVLTAEDDPRPGILTEDGDINWDCPCLGGMPIGPCGVEFREAFTCFHTSEADPKGADCLDAFRIMTECMSNFPVIYGNNDNKLDDMASELEGEKASVTPVSESDSTEESTKTEDKTISETSSQVVSTAA